MQTAATDKQVIFLTATISPRVGTYLLARFDPELRRKDYVDAFRFYASCVAQHGSYQLVLVENSGSSVQEFLEIAEEYGIADRTECLTYLADDNPEFSRFYLEAALIRKALEMSALMQADGVTIWKITGRYIIPNIASIITKQPKNFDIYLNFRNYPQRALDFYVAGFTRAGMSAIVNRIADRFETHVTGEDLLRDAVEEGVYDDLKVVPRLNVVPKIKGARGHDNRSYHGAVQSLKYITRVLANTIAPRIWI